MKADQHVLLLCDGDRVRVQHSGPCRARARGAVLIDVDTLSTLPDRELASGISEIVKYGLIRDPALFAWLEANMERLLQRDPQVPRAPQARITAASRVSAVGAQRGPRDDTTPVPYTRTGRAATHSVLSAMQQRAALLHPALARLPRQRALCWPAGSCFGARRRRVRLQTHAASEAWPAPLASVGRVWVSLPYS